MDHITNCEKANELCDDSGLEIILCQESLIQFGGNNCIYEYYMSITNNHSKAPLSI